jgi:hypothetical protein
MGVDPVRLRRLGEEFRHSCHRQSCAIKQRPGQSTNAAKGVGRATNTGYRHSSDMQLSDEHLREFERDIWATRAKYPEIRIHVDAPISETPTHGPGPEPALSPIIR